MEHLVESQLCLMTPAGLLPLTLHLKGHQTNQDPQQSILPDIHLYTRKQIIEEGV